jgi:hypothetical protein
MQRLEAALGAANFVSENCPDFIDYANCFTLLSSMRLMADILIAGKSNYPDEYEIVKKQIDENRNCQLASPRHRIMLALLDISPSMYVNAYRIRQGQ